MDGYAYAGRCKCGEVVSVVADESDLRKLVAEEVKQMILRGLTVERVTHEYVRQHWGECRCPRQQRLL